APTCCQPVCPGALTLPLYDEGKHGKGELKYINGLPVLIVEGTPKEIGEQIGTLTKKPLARLLNFPEEFLKTKLKAKDFKKTWSSVVDTSKKMLKRFPPDHREELVALINASELSLDLGVVANVFPDIRRIGGCSTLIVEGERSTTG